MADELRWVLVIISALVIGGLLLHGLWSVRKKDQAEAPAASTPTSAPESAEQTVQPRFSAERDEPELGNISINVANEASHAELDKIDLNNLDDLDDDFAQPEEAPEQQTTQNQSSEVPADFIILHIQMPEGLSMQGASLLPLLLSLGFKFSPEGFFNRHQDPSGNGPVLFRLVNMFNPGTFDIDNMEQLSTAGVSLFMTLPCEGDSLPAFNMLHSAAKKLADEFGAQVYDHNRELLTVAMVRQYVEKIREFDQ